MSHGHTSISHCGCPGGNSATLKVNGVTISTKTSSNRVFTWPGVTLAPGANLVEVSGARGGVTYTDSVTWTLS